MRNQMDNKAVAEGKVKHVQIYINDDHIIPMVFEFEEGYGRTGYFKTEDGKTLTMFAVSDTKTLQPSAKYSPQKEEKYTQLFGFVVNSPEHAIVLSEYFRKLAMEMEDEE